MATVKSDADCEMQSDAALMPFTLEITFWDQVYFATVERSSEIGEKRV